VLDQVFAADSALMRVLGRFGDLMLLNLLFVVTSLPLVTLGASLTALQSVSMAIVRGRADDDVVRRYLRSFRAHLRPGSKLLAALAGLALVLVAWYLVVNALVSPVAQLVLLAIWIVLTIQLVMTGLFAFGYLASFDDPIRTVLRNSLLLSWKHPLASITLLALLGLPVVITVFYPKMTGYGLVWLIVGFAAVAATAATLLARIFDRYAPAPPAAPTPEQEAVRALT
jgi:uncharacterized membrane protein YesL